MTATRFRGRLVARLHAGVNRGRGWPQAGPVAALVATTALTAGCIADDPGSAEAADSSAETEVAAAPDPAADPEDEPTAGPEGEETSVGEQRWLEPVSVDAGEPDSRQVAFAADGPAEDAAVQPPEPDEPEPAEVEVADVGPDVPQAEIGVSEAALCATVQIGRDAVVDGDADLAARQRDRLINGIGPDLDPDLDAILRTIEPGLPLAPNVIDGAMDRCVDLGFEP